MIGFEKLSLLVLLLMPAVLAEVVPIKFGRPCEGIPQSPIYCYGDLLHTVQRAKLYKDQATFVQTPLKVDPEVVIDQFDKLGLKGEHLSQAERKELEDFVDENFDKNFVEFEPWIPTDWDDSPSLLNSIADDKLREFASSLNNMWKRLGRQVSVSVKNSRGRHSQYYLAHPGIIPHSKSKHFYNWDVYWIQRGLIACGMTSTAKQMIENLLELVEKLKFVPGGGRIYHQRTQPPLLIPMVDNYFEATKDVQFIKDNIQRMISEFEFFFDNRTVSFKVNESVYRMAYYAVNITGPRPEYYSDDYDLVNSLQDEQQKIMLYANLKSAVESGWEFSSRWFVTDSKRSITEGKLQDTNTRAIIPVDLNSYLCWNAELLMKFCSFVMNTSICDPVEYLQITVECKRAIFEVLWDEEAGIWFDFDYVKGSKRKYFFPTNLTPLWVQAHHGEIDGVAKRVVEYLQLSGAINYPGGIPTSLLNSGQLWDFPTSWPVLNHIVVEALENTNVKRAQDLAFELAQRWVRSNHAGFLQTGSMFEKYNATIVGVEELISRNDTNDTEAIVAYSVTNGVILDLLQKYGSRLTPMAKLPHPFNNGTHSAGNKMIASAWTISIVYFVATLIM